MGENEQRSKGGAQRPTCKERGIEVRAERTLNDGDSLIANQRFSHSHQAAAAVAGMNKRRALVVALSRAGWWRRASGGSRARRMSTSDGGEGKGRRALRLRRRVGYYHCFGEGQ